MNLRAILSLSLVVVTQSAAQGDFWQQTNGPFGGSVTSLTITDAGHFIAGTARAGVFRSTNSGVSWNSTSVSNSSITSLIVAPNGSIFSVGVGSVSRSTDDGQSWTFLDQTLGFSSLTNNSLGHLFAGSKGSESGGVFRSTDNGANWEPINNGLIDLAVNTVAVNSLGHIFVGTGNEEYAAPFGGVFRSTDNGENWTQINNGLSSPNVDIVAVDNSDHVFVYTGYPLRRTFRSTNNGETWNPTHSEIPSALVQRIAFDHHNDVYAACTGGLFRSTDDGENWIRVNGVSYASDFLTTPDGNMYVGGIGVLKSTDNGGSWSESNHGIIASHVVLLATNGRGDAFATTTNGIFRTTNKGMTWERVPLMIHKAISLNGTIFANGSDGLYRSTNNGEDWIWASNGLSTTRITAMDVDFLGHLFATTSLGFFSSTDDGVNWIQISGLLDGLPPTSLSINSHGVMFAGNSSNRVYRSTDIGETWIQVVAGPWPNASHVRTITCDSNSTIVAGLSYGGLLVSTDTGSTWSQEIFGSPLSGVYSAEINSIGHIFVGSTEGTFSSTDHGSHWKAINGGRTAGGPLLSLALAPDGFLYGGSDGGGVFRSVESTTPDYMPPPDPLPKTFSLFQNFPNPFNPGTTFRFSLPRNSLVTIRVYDVRGSQVGVPVSQQFVAGTHSVPWDAKGVSSGLYFYRLEADGYMETKKMMVLR